MLALLKEQVESKAYTKQIEDGFSKLKGLHVELSATHDSLVAKHDGLEQVHSKNIAAAKEREDKHQKLVHESKAMALKIKELEHALELYCLVIVDDFTQYTWTLFLGEKSEVSELFKIFARRA